jgi:catechol-2,3-dioxygenase
MGANISGLLRATLETPDLARQSAYFEHVLGLAPTGESATARFFACGAETHAIALRAGAVARCASIAFRVDAATDLKALRSKLTEQGITAGLGSDPAPGVREQLTMIGPENIEVELTHESDEPPSATPQDGIRPIKLGHVAFNVEDVQGAVRFFVETLGFRVSDWMGDFFAFLRCGPDHHTVNFVHGARTKMHHIAFEGRDWNHIGEACDFLGSREIPLIWGPGRHGIGHNIFIYHHNPDGQIVELYTQLDQMSDETLGYFDPRPWHEDNPQRPKVWKPGPRTSNIWGIPTPQSFRD